MSVDPFELSESLRNPQLEPSDHCWTVLQDFGPNGGGWGPSAVSLPWMPEPRPFVYTGEAEHVIQVLQGIVRALAQETGRPTMLCRYTGREDVFIVGGAS
jgi:hypothetical protein